MRLMVSSRSAIRRSKVLFSIAFASLCAFSTMAHADDPTLGTIKVTAVSPCSTGYVAVYSGGYFVDCTSVSGTGSTSGGTTGGGIGGGSVPGTAPPPFDGKIDYAKTDSTHTCSDGDILLATANAIAYPLAAGCQKGDGVKITWGDGRAQVWEFISCGTFRSSTVINSAPVSGLDGCAMSGPSGNLTGGHK